jgi:HAD superfamily hydrolase (TIGR01509 family)
VRRDDGNYTRKPLKIDRCHPEEKQATAMNKIKAIIFDMDGVLVDSEAIKRNCMRKCTEKYSLPFEDEFYALFLGCNDEMSVKIMTDRYRDEDLVVNLMNDINRLSKEEFEKGSFRLKRGCREILDHLKKKNIPYALATGSSYDYVEMDFLRNGYDEVPFKYIVTGDRITHSKPDPEIFLKAAELMKQDIRDCLIIEDSPKGIEAAYRSGARSCFIPDLVKPNPEILKKADYHRNDLFELIHLIDDLTA